MSDYTEEQLDGIWQKGISIRGVDANIYRLDVAGAVMKRELYGNEGNLGWEVDHIYPKEKLKANKVPEARWSDIMNLRPMNAKNNVAKGEAYPIYDVAVQRKGQLMSNEEVDGVVGIVDVDLQQKIKEHYKAWLS